MVMLFTFLIESELVSAFSKICLLLSASFKIIFKGLRNWSNPFQFIFNFNERERGSDFFFNEEYSTEMYKSGRVTASCKSDFKYKVLGFYNLIKMLYSKTTVGLLFKVFKQWSLGKSRYCQFLDYYATKWHAPVFPLCEILFSIIKLKMSLCSI